MVRFDAGKETGGRVTESLDAGGDVAARKGAYEIMIIGIM
jgi:hypothetical protein